MYSYYLNNYCHIIKFKKIYTNKKYLSVYEINYTPF
jgi:hypothetical protein